MYRPMRLCSFTFPVMVDELNNLGNPMNISWCRTCMTRADGQTQGYQDWSLPIRLKRLERASSLYSWIAVTPPVSRASKMLVKHLSNHQCRLNYWTRWRPAVVGLSLLRQTKMNFPTPEQVIVFSPLACLKLYQAGRR